VGRPNVGKSSLFNRLLGRKRALVLDTPGVTRDRIVEPAQWFVQGKQVNVNLIDTGGMGPGQFSEEIALQVKTALDEAQVVLFVVDYQVGLTDADEAVLLGLKKAGVLGKTPIIGVVNKVDSENFEDALYAFYSLGFDNYMAVSSEHNLGIDDLKDMIALNFSGDVAQVKNHHDDETDDEVRMPRIPRIAIIGQPNVGKSTLLNAICGEKRAIVSPIAGTTVDSIDTQIHWNGKDYILIDTAGIRRKDKTEQGVEVLSVVQTRKTLERADLTLLVMDASKGVYDQDEKIAGLIEEAGSSVIMVLNKWDTQKVNPEFSQKKAEETVREQVRFLGYAPLVFSTAIEGLGLGRLIYTIERVLEQRWLKLQTSDLTEFVRSEAEIHNPNNAKFYFTHQTGRNPPSFVSHVSDPRKIHFSLTRHIIRALREKWGYWGTPIRFNFVKTKNSGEK
jgi:GTP-binding protein